MKIAALPIIAISACTLTTRPTLAIECGTTCVSDPRPHCIAEHDCTDDADCPSGQACQVSPIVGLGCVAPLAKACRLPAGGITHPRALTVGFQTEEISIHFEDGAQPIVAWDPPAGAIAMACAVFSCDPVFRAHTGTSNADRGPTNSDARPALLPQIANANACMYTYQEVDASRGAVSITSTPSSVASCDVTEAREPVIDYLAVGCWAYDDYHVVAASELVELPAAVVAKAFPTVPTTSACPSEGAACRRDTGSVGRCVAGACQARCVSAQDCELAGSVSPTETCDWECAPVDGTDVGVCTPTP